jgi:hypothetical protein
MRFIYNLIPLKIPPYWAVLHNYGFYSDDMIVENGVIVNDLAYRPSMLFMVQINSSNEFGVVRDKTGFAIDLGWYPEADPNGSYKLELLKGTVRDTVYEYKSFDKYKIQHVLNELMYIATKSRDIDIIKDLIRMGIENNPDL